MTASSNQQPLRIENATPILRVADMQRSLDFYTNLLGFEVHNWSDEVFASIGRDGAGIYLCSGAQGSSGTWVWLGFDGDAEALHEQLTNQGVTIRMPPTNFSWAMEIHVEDPDGHVLRLGCEPDDDQPFCDDQVGELFFGQNSD